MDLGLVKGLLEDINRQSRELINLVIGLQNDNVFGEPMEVTLKTKLLVQANTRYGALKTLWDSLTVEIKK